MKKIFICLLVLLLVCGCSNQTQQVIEEEPITEEINLEGEYMDSVSQRASMIITKDSDTYYITVNWASSANEYKEWSMEAHLEDNKLKYAGEGIATHEFDEEGKEIVGCGAINNLGYFEIEDGKLLWTGAGEENCRTCTFEKIPE